jgi:hypothetical protein
MTLGRWRRGVIFKNSLHLAPSLSLLTRVPTRFLELTVPGYSVAWTWISTRNLLSVSRVLGAVDYVLVAATELTSVFTSSVVSTVVAVAILDLDVELEVAQYM